MSTPFMGEIKLISWNFPPKGWAFCNGQLLPINQNQALFSLMGTRYGGDGRVNFGLPNLEGRLPMHTGQGFVLGETIGAAVHTVGTSEMPAHTHTALGHNETLTATALNSVPTTKTFGEAQVAQQGGTTAPLNLYGPYAAPTSMAPGAVTSVGGSQAHNNMMPYLVLNFIVALQGIFPSET